MPSVSRTPLTATTGTGGTSVAAAVDVLLDRQLQAVVDLVAWVDGPTLHVANAAGHATCPSSGGDWTLVAGELPVPSEDELHGVPLAAALADPSPPNDRNSYPEAARRLAGIFRDAARAPDLVVVHTPGHYWPERGGHPGEHGSLDAGQSRAPLLLSGAGVSPRGVLPRSSRVIDVAATMAHACGVPFPGIDGVPLTDVVAAGAGHVVGMLWDGTNCNDLLAMTEKGQLPSVRRLLAHGCAFAGGAVAEFPSVTLTNHASVLTGVGPGRHGIVNNTYFDRALGRQVVANDASTWHRACDHLRDGVKTIFEVVNGPSACINEPIDRGAVYSTFGLVRATGEAGGARDLRDALPDPLQDRHANRHLVASDDDYAWSTQVDAFGLQQVLEQWSVEVDPPRLTWWNTTVTDTGHHAGGPYSRQSRASLVDADRRLGVFLDLLEHRDLLAETTFVLTADHGSEAADPACRGDWDIALREAGVHFRDESYGFIYLGV